ncbi:MAG: PepSY domain-containing protein [Pelagimonas sp.]|uniref:PepSY domain-containing protein n=1 Tax=Pelagimonas sp. TaxID=2073170 RepID=UPI003D6B22D2
MTFETFKLAGLSAMIASVPVLAYAQLQLGDQVGTQEAVIRAWLEAQGAQVTETELDDGEIEVEYILDGAEYEAELDPATGAVIALELDDDDDGDDDEDDS